VADIVVRVGLCDTYQARLPAAEECLPLAAGEDRPVVLAPPAEACLPPAELDPGVLVPPAEAVLAALVVAECPLLAAGVPRLALVVVDRDRLRRLLRRRFRQCRSWVAVGRCTTTARRRPTS
jgi:hypothetical protein